jgi:hypothetical protein
MEWGHDDTLALRQDLAVLSMTLDLLDDCPAVPDDMRRLVAIARARLTHLVERWGAGHEFRPSGAG